MSSLNLDNIHAYQEALNNHRIFTSDVITDIEDLGVFMEHHVYAVWDFMSLVKSLQNIIAPSGGVWMPHSKAETKIARLINEIVLGEETDLDMEGNPCSHFQLYVRAMHEVNADTSNILDFIRNVSKCGASSYARWLQDAPHPARAFCTSTFAAAAQDAPHIVAATFAFGRETAIPSMFDRLVDQLDKAGIAAPTLKYYLNRHIQVDGEEHGPAALDLVHHFCEDNPRKLIEAEIAALAAINHRMIFWSEVEYAIKQRRL